jgi:hypothetical protein
VARDKRIFNIKQASKSKRQLSANFPHALALIQLTSGKATHYFREFGMKLNHQHNQLIEAAHYQSNSVLIEIWRIKDARAIKFQDAAGLMRHLQNKYGDQKR